MSGRSNNAGIYNFDNLNAQSLFIRGKPFEQFITELSLLDQFEQGEIDEIKLLLLYLNTSGLSSEWIVDNNNKNQDLKTLITALETKLAQIDTIALTQPSVLNNDNRNSVLKTRIDGHDASFNVVDASMNAIFVRANILDASMNTLTGRVDGNDGSIGTLNGKTRYVSSTQGTNGNPNTFSDFIVNVNDRILNKVLLETADGANMIAMVTNTSTLQGQNDFPNNRILLNAPAGRIQMDCKSLQLQGTLIEMGADFVIGGESEIRIGQKKANIKIGSHQAPDLNEPTIITIGSRSATQNTHTNLEGNVFTNEARFESLSKSQALSLSALLGIITSSGLPLYINIISALGLSSYVHSDLFGLAGTLVKNGDLATTNDIKIKSYSLYNTDLNFIDLFPVENTFIASGSSSKTLLLGSIKEQVFKNGSDITLRHNNIVATNVNWVLSEANDNVNALCIKGDDGILLHQGASSVGASMKILNSKSGKIELLIGNAGTQASCLTGLTVDFNSGQPQVICGTKGGLLNIQQTKSKLLVHQSDTAGDVGIEVVKNPANSANAPLNRTTISDNNIDTPSLSLKTNFTGTTTKALYLDGQDNLNYNGNLVTPVKDIVAGAHISVTNNNGVYTIAKTGGGGSVVDVGEDLIISATAVQLPRKSSFYGQTFLRFIPISRQFFDVYMSANGKYICFANRTTTGNPATILSTNDYGNQGFFTESNVSKLWIAICGTTEGSRIFATGSNEVWANTPPSTTWTQQTTPPNFGGAIPVQFKCSGDGKHQLITDAGSFSFGSIYKSNNTGATWTQQNITGIPTAPLGCCVNASGKTQYVVCDGTNNNINAENGAGGLYRSQDFGANWTRVIATPNGNHQRVACDATGRYVALVGSGLLFTSKNYGATFISHAITSTRSIWVSSGGDYMWVGILSASNNFFFSTDHGHTFTQGNTTPDGNYIGMANDCIACNNDGSIVVAGSVSGLRINSCREFPNDVRQLSAGTGLVLTNLGNGASNISLDLGVVELSPTYIDHGGFTNNAFSFNYQWDFQNYEYDITVDIQQKIGTGSRMNWTWDNDLTFNVYQQNWRDHDGANFNGTGHNINLPHLLFLYNDNNLHHHFKARLRQAYNPLPEYYRRLVLEHSCVQSPFSPDSITFNGPFRNSRGYNQRVSLTNPGSEYPFSGNRTITFWITNSNYFSQNRAHLRIYRIPIRN